MWSAPIYTSAGRSPLVTLLPFISNPLVMALTVRHVDRPKSLDTPWHSSVKELELSHKSLNDTPQTSLRENQALNPSTTLPKRRWEKITLNPSTSLHPTLIRENQAPKTLHCIQRSMKEDKLQLCNYTIMQLWFPVSLNALLLILSDEILSQSSFMTILFYLLPSVLFLRQPRCCFNWHRIINIMPTAPLGLAVSCCGRSLFC